MLLRTTHIPFSQAESISQPEAPEKAMHEKGKAKSGREVKKKMLSNSSRKPSPQPPRSKRPVPYDSPPPVGIRMQQGQDQCCTDDVDLIVLPASTQVMHALACIPGYVHM